MTTNINSLFPLIDDPANIFYSKLKQWMLMEGSYHLTCKALARTLFEITCSFKGMSRVYKYTLDTRELSLENDIDKYVYFGLTLKRLYITTEENTTSGYAIPTKWSALGLKENKPKIKVVTNYNTNVFIEENLDYDTSEYTKDEFNLYFYVGKLVRFAKYDAQIPSNKIEYESLDIDTASRKDMKVSFNTLYRRSVGREWKLYPSQAIQSADSSYANSVIRWELYDIDSDNNSTLIDSSDNTFSSFGYSNTFATQYGPSLDHLASFVCENKVITSGSSTICSIKVLERDKRKHYNTPLFARMNKECEPFCNTLGLSPVMFEHLFNGLHLNKSVGSPHVEYYKETIILLLSYITNVNIRWFIERRYGNGATMWGNLVNIASDNTYKDDWSYLELVPNESIYKNVFVNNFFSGYQNTSFGSLLSSDSASSYYNLYNTSPSTDSSNPDTNLPIVQNSAPTSTLPTDRWYEKEYVYLLLLWRMYSARYLHGQRYALNNDSNLPLSVLFYELESFVEPRILNHSVKNKYLSFFTESIMKRSDYYDEVYR